MRNFFVLLVFASLFTFTACDTGQEPTDDPAEEFDASIIQGTWEMTHHMPGDTNVVVPVGFKQYKFYTKDRVFFIAYDADSIGLIGGGTYSITRDSFTEHLEFMTMEMNPASTNPTFSHKIDGNTFVQKGVITEGGEDGRDFQLEEHFKKVEPSIAAASDHPYVGLWKMTQVQNGEATELQSVPDSVIRMKIITPGHFFIVNWSKNRLMPYSAVFGSQKMEGGKYVETIITSTMSQDNNGIVIPYSVEGGERTFRMHGEVPLEVPFKIDERYTRVE